MDTTEFEELLQDYLWQVDYGTEESAADAAYKALTEAAGLLSVSMLRQRG